jgi:S1-C subfamily serine protease
MRKVARVALPVMVGAGVWVFISALAPARAGRVVVSKPAAQASMAPAAPPPGSAHVSPAERAALVRVARRSQSSLVLLDAYNESDNGPIHRSAAGTLALQHGYVLAPGPVIANADFVVVTFSNGTRAPGRVQGVDPATGLALVTVGSVPRHAACALVPEDKELGETATVMIRPHGHAPLLGRTHVSAPTPVPTVEADVTGDPGALGGALFDARGRLAGLPVAEGEAGAKGPTPVYAVPPAEIRAAVERILERTPGVTGATILPARTA